MIKAINTTRAPQAIGPYSQAIKASGMLFISGQIPLDPASGEIGAEGIKRQTELVLSHIQAILDVEGLNLGQVVKTEIFLKDMEDFKAMNDVYASFFTQEPRPARHVIQAAKLPKDVSVEISCIAVLS